ALQLSFVNVTLNQVIRKAAIEAGNLKFVPVADANGTGYDSFGFSVNDGTVDSASTYSMTIDVTSVNDAPAFVALDATALFIEGGPAVVLDGNVEIRDSELDSFNAGLGLYEGASVTLVRNGGANGEDVFSESGTLSALTEGNDLLLGTTIAGTITTNSAGTLVLTFNTNATTALVNSTLQQITYTNSSDTPPATTRIDWSFDDANVVSQGTGAALQGTGSSTVLITATNDAPVFTQAGLVANATFDSDLSNWTTTGQVSYSAGELRFGMGAVPGNHRAEQTITTLAGAAYELTFDYRDDMNTHDQSLQVSVDGAANLLTTGHILSDIAGNAFVQYTYSFIADATSAKLTFTDTSDTSALTVGGGGAVDGYLDNIFVQHVPTFTEGAVAVVLGADIQISDAELDALNGGLGNYDGARVTLVRNGGANAEDVFSNTALLNALSEGAPLIYNTSTLGTVTTNSSGTLVLTFNTLATSTLVDATLQSIAYGNVSDAPPATTRIDWTFDDANSGSQGSGGALQGSDTTTVMISAINDAPLLTGDLNATVDEGGAYTFTASDLGYTDPDDVDTGITFTTFGASNGKIQVNGLDASSFSGVALSGGQVRFVHDDTETLSASFDVSVEDGDEDASVAPDTTFNLSVTALNDPPVNTVPAAQSVNEDTSLALTGIRVNDADLNLSTVQVSVTSGVLSVRLRCRDTILCGGSSISAGANGSADMTLSGFESEINETLATLSYQGQSDYYGTDTLSLLSTDESGATDADAVVISINAVNDGPTVLLHNAITILAENTTTTPRVKIADIVVSDDLLGSNSLSLSGADAGLFEIDATALYLSSGSILDFAANPSLDIHVQVNDTSVAPDPNDFAALSISITDTTAPVLTIDTPLTANLSNQGAFQVSGRCTFGDGDVTVSIAGASPFTKGVTCTASAWSTAMDVSGISDGIDVVNINATQTDAAGNTGNATVKKADKDTIAPVVPSVNSQSTFDVTPVITGTATLGAGETLTVLVAGATYTPVPSGTDWSVDTAMAVPDSGVFAPNTGAPDGLVTNEVLARTTDAANNTSVDITSNELIIDVDSDNDAIPDALEGNGDSDADTIPNYLDPDSDGDGIPDALEHGASGVDDDNDGIDNTYDVDHTLGVDANSDGIDDNITPRDTDNDGLADYLDIDADDDGIPDTIESALNELADADADQINDVYDVDVTQGTDNNHDGIDDAITVIDSDADALADFIDPDSDNDGLPDSIEAHDANKDGIADTLPTLLDSDGDGLDDGYDTVTGAGPGNVTGSNADLSDNDGDGIADYLDSSGADSDADGTPDQLDPDNTDACIPDNTPAACDSDGDGLSDGDELSQGTLPDNPDSDGDGIPDGIENGDADGDGINDAADTDSDNDGIDDAVEAGPTPSVPIDTDSDGLADVIDPDADDDGIPDYMESGADTDGDGIANYLDPDSDGDGLPDAVEDPVNTGLDTDSDGIDDGYDVDQTGGSDVDNNGVDDAIVSLDSDGDGAVNFLDTDSDNDGIADTIESSLDVLNDADSDQINDVFDIDTTQGITSRAQGIDDRITVQDTDGDTTPDYLDLDSDNDSLLDVTEAGGVDANGDGLIDDAANNQASLVTPTDTDGDGIGDWREVDSDDDGIADIQGTRFELLDADGDGVVDNTTDLDGDGIAELNDQSVGFGTLALAGAEDGDRDQDGIPDEVEGTDDVDGDGLANFQDTDSDGDGIPDSIEAGVIPGLPIDTDNDNTPDYLDLDADGDGISDQVEGVNDANNNGIADYIDTAEEIITGIKGTGGVGLALILILLVVLSVQINAQGVTLLLLALYLVGLPVKRGKVQ
ncbi:MAG: DUF642 domain-containing protein, partial [Gammaproteobacteria bacterium]|nr:DUF642 domain-containing protein [Gammaproteobacteria bacterium]